jgi:hypothetical protein
VQSMSLLAKKMDARVKPAHDDLCTPRSRQHGNLWDLSNAAALFRRRHTAGPIFCFDVA